MGAFLQGWLLCAAVTGAVTSAMAMNYVETPMFTDKVKVGELPGVTARLPQEPSVVHFTGEGKIGRQGGELRTLIGRAKDIRLLVTLEITHILSIRKVTLEVWVFFVMKEVARDP